MDAEKDADRTIDSLLTTIEELQTHIHSLESQLSKWLAPHEDSELQEMKEQSKQASFSAKQAYINALEWRVKHLESQLNEEDGIILKKPYNPDPMPHQDRTLQPHVEWNEEEIEEIEKWSIEMFKAEYGNDYYVTITHDDLYRISNYIPKLLSLLKKERVEKRELESKLSMTINTENKRIGTLEEGIEKLIKILQNSSVPQFEYIELKRSLCKLVEKK